ncbi:sensor histidine kinase [Actinokineospora xionganensis]|uniref:histidine kinase n=1 Tax=Actinokineospora xionganensis TaxID=2684470 RepID=A0ABR7L488_9PSEU|nr:nitrate- and nitrite sensing domain-containing protein [Actinokineospora xionganensis]MBC6447387.1 nitrate- and nitrite sensing domain-containing protein [Actinokineospora xionganensis]
MQRLNRLRGSGTIQSRVLAIALIPSIAILLVGVALSVYLAYQGVSTQSFADNVRGALGPSSRVIVAVQEERRLTTLQVTGSGGDPGALDRQRREVDTAVKELAATTEALAADAPDELSRPLERLNETARELPATRQLVDSGTATVQQVYDFYGELVDFVGEGVQGIARSATDAEVGFEQMISSELFRSVEAQARSHVLVERAMANGLDTKEFHELAHQMGTYHELIETIVPRLTEQERKQYTALKATPNWKTLVAGDDSIMAKGPGKHEVPFDVAAWEDANRKVSAGLIDLYKSHSSYAADLGTDSGSRVLATSLAAGLTILLVAIAAMLIALRLSRSLIRRLTRLRVETLDVAEHKLPDVIDRLGRGERVDVEAELPLFDHGDDEIGQVANAFGKAQRTAVAATAKEAEIRQGVRSVFLNIAHRSQVMVHRQLKVLDKAERSEDDPDQLALLFQLDHLATRSRRNAESLIILGGKQPGRRWRNPVALLDVVRSAVAETEDYERVNTGKLPEVSLQGAVVADLIHLLAELIDNATSFSPPETHVDVVGTLVGRGVVIEIEDQGLGIEEDQLEDFNRRLQSPPDFGVMALSGESRIGLFVVGRLATQHGIKVALRESIYGGVRAVVLVPNSVVVREPGRTGEPAPAPEPVTPEPTRPDPLHRRTSGQLPIGRVAEPAPALESNGFSTWMTPADEQAAPATSSNGNGNGNGRAKAGGDFANPSIVDKLDRAGGAPTQRIPQTPLEPPRSTKPAPSKQASPPASVEPPRLPAAPNKHTAPLARRTPRANLAAQLRKEPGQAPADPAPPASIPTPERSRASMSAFQRGTRRARAGEPETGARPGRPGEET